MVNHNIEQSDESRDSGGSHVNPYDDDPVYFCRRCLSLSIKQIPFDEHQEYCESCGAVDIGTADIEEWKEMYRKKYGHDFVIKKERKWPYWC